MFAIAENDALRVHSHLRFIWHELFSPHNHEKWVHNPILNFSVHSKVGQLVSVNAPANSSHHSSCLIIFKYEWTLREDLNLEKANSKAIFSLTIATTLAHRFPRNPLKSGTILLFSPSTNIQNVIGWVSLNVKCVFYSNVNTPFLV